MMFGGVRELKIWCFLGAESGDGLGLRHLFGYLVSLFGSRMGCAGIGVRACRCFWNLLVSLVSRFLVMVVYGDGVTVSFVEATAGL